MERGGVLCPIDLFLLLGRLLILDVFDALAGNVSEGVGDLLAGVFPIGCERAFRVTLHIDLVQNKVAERVQHVWNLCPDCELIRRSLLLEGDVEDLEQRA